MEIYNKIVQTFYKLAYRAILVLFFFTRPTVYGVYVAVWHKDRLLVIKNSYKKGFTLPCGRVKRGENKAAAAARELQEEVCIKLDKDQLRFVGDYAGKFKHATDVGTFFEITMTQLPQVQVDNREVVWAQFVPLDQIDSLNLSPTVETWLKLRSSRTESQL